MSTRFRRLLLIYPPFYRLYGESFGIGRNPLGLSYIAGAVMRDTTWEVMIYNADYCFQDQGADVRFLAGEGFQNYIRHLSDIGYIAWKEIREVIEEYEPKVVGISSMSQTFASARVAAQIAKSIDSDIVVVLGGPHPSMVRTDVLQDPNIDIGVFGEGEATMVHLLDAIDHGRSLTSVSGIVFKSGTRLAENPKLEPIQDLDSLPFPIEVVPRVLKDYDKYPKEAFWEIFAVRGCPNSCSFCGSRHVWSRTVRWRSPQNVVLEMRKLQEAGLNHIYFADDTFGVTPSRIRELCNAIRQECLNITWYCEMHVSLVSTEITLLMKDAGCRHIQIGVESGNNEMLRKIRKNITVEEAVRAAETIRGNGLLVDAFFMIGFPEETEETLMDTINLIRNFPCDYIMFSVFTPYPGTALFEYCKQHDIIADDFDVSLHNHQSPLNYFCPKIPKQLFVDYFARIVEEVDAINARKTFERITPATFGQVPIPTGLHLLADVFKRNASREGLRKLRKLGLKGTFLRLANILRRAILQLRS